MNPVAKIYVQAALSLPGGPYVREAAFEDIAFLLRVPVEQVREMAWRERRRLRRLAYEASRTSAAARRRAALTVISNPAIFNEASA